MGRSAFVDYFFMYLAGFLNFFFFSSRRRHTIFSRDWSSDVCSSDLLYYGQPRGIEADRGFNTMSYTRAEIEQVAHVAFRLARNRRKKVTSVDKSNVLEVSQLWRKVVTELAAQYPDVKLDHMFVDNAAMQMVLRPTQ